MDILQKKILKLCDKHNIKVEQNTLYSLNKYINNLHEKEYKAFDFNELTDSINKSYVLKSIKSEEYFIKNIAHTYNSKTKENLFDLSNTTLSKNFNKALNKKAYNRLVKLSKKMKKRDSTLENSIIETNKNLFDYTHNKNTSFIESLDNKYSSKKIAKVKYLDFKNKDKTPVMLTMTVDSNFRKYVKINPNIDSTLGVFENLREINEDGNLQELIENSYFKLNETFRDFYQHFKVLNKRSGDEDKLDYILCFEAHHSLTLHLHILFYVNDTQYNNLRCSWALYLKKLSKKQRKGQDFKVIDTDIALGSTYLAKYLMKNYSSNEEDEISASFYQKFKRYFSKFKLFRTSNFYFTSQKKIDLMYSYLCKNYPDILELLKSTATPLYLILEQLEVRNVFKFSMDKNKAIVFDRKLMKKFYEVYSNDGIEDYKIKEEIENNIDFFANVVDTSKVVKGVFHFKYKVIKELLEEYKIDTSSLVDEDIPKDKFYKAGIYTFKKYKKLNHSMAVIESMEI